MTYDRWDVVTVDFPFQEGGDTKRRPALVVSGERLRHEHGLYWIAMITTAKSGRKSDDVSITNVDRSGLPEDCVVRLSRILAVREQEITRRLGDVPPKDRAQVSALLKRYVP